MKALGKDKELSIMIMLMQKETLMKISRIQFWSALILGCTLMALASACFAQPQAPREMTADTMLSRLQKDLTLTDAQSEKIKSILEEDISKHKALLESSRSSGDRGAVRSEMDALKKDTDAQIAACLTDEQKVIFEKLRTEQEKNIKEGRPSGNAERPADPPPHR